MALSQIGWSLSYAGLKWSLKAQLNTFLFWIARLADSSQRLFLLNQISDLWNARVVGVCRFPTYRMNFSQM